MAASATSSRIREKNTVAPPFTSQRTPLNGVERKKVQFFLAFQIGNSNKREKNKRKTIAGPLAFNLQRTDSWRWLFFYQNLNLRGYEASNLIFFSFETA